MFPRGHVATLVRTLIFSVNALLIGLPDALIHKLQLIQNNAARLVKRSHKSEHVTPLMKELHWLPVKQRIQYKVNLVTLRVWRPRFQKLRSLTME